MTNCEGRVLLRRRALPPPPKVCAVRIERSGEKNPA